MYSDAHDFNLVNSRPFNRIVFYLSLVSVSLFIDNTLAQQPVISQTPEMLRFSVLTTAESSGSMEAMVVQGGAWTTKRKLVHTAVLVQHPEGDFLFDSGIGEAFVSQMEVFNFLEKQLFKIENVHPARQQLDESSYDIERLIGIIPSHMHWDHASGLEDFIGVPVWLQQTSLEEALKGKPPAFVQSQFDSSELVWKKITLTNTAYHGFSASLDIFGDQTAVLVDLSGHTRGQLGLFLNLPDGQRYFFIGDTTWSKLGITHNKPRPVFVNWLVGVDTDVKKNSDVIQAIHELSKAEPSLVIVPAHDELVIQSLPRFPDFSG
jgi:glyoxylase-like metal-dependent hydrolase (beta-lactamase superfamily II)